jgi:hypothetical protein
MGNYSASSPRERRLNLAVGFNPRWQERFLRVASATTEFNRRYATLGFLSRYPALKRRAKVNRRYAAKNRLSSDLD